MDPLTVAISIAAVFAVAFLIQSARLIFRDGDIAVSMRHITPEIHQALLHAAEDAECQFNLCRDIEQELPVPSKTVAAEKRLHLQNAGRYRDLLWKYSVYPDPKTAVSDWELCTNPKYKGRIIRSTLIPDDVTPLDQCQITCDCGRQYVFGQSQHDDVSGDACFIEVTTNDDLAQGNIEHAE